VRVGCEECHLGGQDGQFVFFGMGGDSDDTYDVSSREELVRGNERVLIVSISARIVS